VHVADDEGAGADGASDEPSVFVVVAARSMTLTNLGERESPTPHAQTFDGDDVNGVQGLSLAE
jgi:hypothetical protein